MKTSITKTCFAFASIAAFASVIATGPQAAAQHGQRIQTQTRNETRVQVVDPDHRYQPDFYFGIQFTLKRSTDWHGRPRNTLLIHSVSYGSPAHRAGLEAGDEIRTVNGSGFNWAQGTHHANNLLNQYTSQGQFAGGDDGPIYTARAQTRYVDPHAQPRAVMVVRNVRNGRDVVVTVKPTPEH